MKICNILLVLFLSFGFVYAYDFNFNSTENLVTASTGISNGLHAYNPNGTLYVSSGIDGNIQIDSFDSDFTNIKSVSVECSAYGGDCEYFDCYIKENLTLGTGFECIGDEDLANDYARMTFVPLSSMSPTYLNTGVGSGSTNSIIYPAVSDTALKIWKHGVAENDLRYTITQNFGTDLVGDGAFDLPTTYENVNDIDLVECGGMYHVLISKNGNVYDLIYDYDRNYKTVYLLSPTDWNVSTNQEKYSGWCDKTSSPYSLLFVLVNKTDTFGNVSIQKWAVNPTYTLTNVWSEILSQNEVESSANGTYHLDRPFIMKDYYGRYNLFYEFVPFKQVKVSYDSSCSCSGWVNASICIDDEQLQTRVCAYDCDHEEQYVYSSYCSRQYNISQGIIEQGYEPYYDDSTCDTDWLESLINPITPCQTKINIPYNCVDNISLESSTNLYVDYRDTFGSLVENTDNFTVNLCNPVNICDEYTTSLCNEAKTLNNSWDKTYSSGNAGDTIISKVVLDSAKCGVPIHWTFRDGWNRHRLILTSVLTCDVACKNEYVCVTEGLGEYSVYKNIDCSLNETTKTYCNNGCNEITGLCGGVLPSGGDGEPLGVDDYFNVLFHPNETTKLIYALVGSVVLGLIVMGLSKGLGTDDTGVIFIIGFAVGFIIFTGLSWIPVLYMIVIIFAVGLYFIIKNLK